MPEIGATLREARMRARIDISEIETETKIRAKYLRALENEEWDLLPGPTYVKSFLRTYAEALGLDAKLLVDEYKMRHERLSEVEMQPIGAAAAGRERRRQGPVIPRGAFIALIFVGLIAALYALGSSGDDGDDPDPVATTPTTTTERPERPREEPKKQAPARPKVVRLQIVATGQVNVCLKAGDRTLLNSVTLEEGDKTNTFRSKRFRLVLGNNAARLVINGKSRNVPASSDAIGIEITPKNGRRNLPQGNRPRCG